MKKRTDSFLGSFSRGDTIQLLINLPVEELQDEHYSIGIFNTHSKNLYGVYTEQDLTFIGDGVYMLTLEHDQTVSMLPRVYSVEVAVEQNQTYCVVSKYTFEINKNTQIGCVI